jgi:AbiV family abortive infection protein
MRPLTVEQIQDVRAALLENARALIAEATILLKAGHHARAFALAQFAYEELAKIMTLARLACRVTAGEEIDWKATGRRLRNHESKSRVLGYMIRGVMVEHTPDVELVYKEAAMLNRAKNDSLYVGFDEEGELTAPVTRIPPAFAESSVSLVALLVDCISNGEEKARSLNIDEFVETEEYRLVPELVEPFFLHWKEASGNRATPPPAGGTVG